jgi:hypothetical protein
MRYINFNINQILPEISGNNNSTDTSESSEPEDVEDDIAMDVDEEQEGQRGEVDL